MNIEDEIIMLKEKIKTLEQQQQKNKKADVWADVKAEFKNDFEKFQWIEDWSYNRDGKTEIMHQSRYYVNDVATAIGTLIRCTLKKTRLKHLEEKDKSTVREITKQILNVLFQYKEGSI